MAAALPSHMTFFSDLRAVPDDVVQRVATWTAFYKQNRELLGGMVYPLLEDPVARGWTALQPWDPEAGRGALLAFRQRSESPAQRIPLENVPPNRRFDLFEGPTGAYVDTLSSRQLRAGIEVELPAPDTAKVLLIKPAPGRP
jgi:hypothetical protein